MRIETRVVGSLSSISSRTCSIQSIIMARAIRLHSLHTTNLRRLLVVLESVLWCVLGARGVMVMTQHVPCCSTCSRNTSSFTEAMRMGRLGGRLVATASHRLIVFHWRVVCHWLALYHWLALLRVRSSVLRRGMRLRMRHHTPNAISGSSNSGSRKNSR